MTIGKPLLASLLAACLVVGFLSGWKWKALNQKKAQPRIIRLGQSKLTNPLLACDPGKDPLDDQDLTRLHEQLTKTIDRLVKQGLAKKFSIYFNDLNGTDTIEINADEGFEPASLIKLPLMMEYLKRAEHDPGVLSKTLTYDGKKDWNEDQTFKPAKTLEAGKAYTADELIYRMMAFSDNNAFRLLLTDADREYLQKIHGQLGVKPIDSPSGAKLVSVKSYAIFLRTLYNASFLNQEMSEKALGYLTAADFPQGITSTVPASITVASKFGERITGDAGEIKQLHDFGIVYYPSRPYILCIMSEGSDFNNLTKCIQEVSRLIYVAFDAQSRKLIH